MLGRAIKKPVIDWNYLILLFAIHVKQEIYVIPNKSDDWVSITSMKNKIVNYFQEISACENNIMVLCMY